MASDNLGLRAFCCWARGLGPGLGPNGLGPMSWGGSYGLRGLRPGEVLRFRSHFGSRFSAQALCRCRCRAWPRSLPRRHGDLMQVEKVVAFAGSPAQVAAAVQAFLGQHASAGQEGAGLQPKHFLWGGGATQGAEAQRGRTVSQAHAKPQSWGTGAQRGRTVSEAHVEPQRPLGSPRWLGRQRLARAGLAGGLGCWPPGRRSQGEEGEEAQEAKEEAGSQIPQEAAQAQREEGSSGPQKGANPRERQGATSCPPRCCFEPRPQPSGSLEGEVPLEAEASTDPTARGMLGVEDSTNPTARETGLLGLGGPGQVSVAERFAQQVAHKATRQSEGCEQDELGCCEGRESVSAPTWPPGRGGRLGSRAGRETVSAPTWQSERGGREGVSPPNGGCSGGGTCSDGGTKSMPCLWRGRPQEARLSPRECQVPQVWQDRSHRGCLLEDDCRGGRQDPARGVGSAQASGTDTPRHSGATRVENRVGRLEGLKQLRQQEGSEAVGHRACSPARGRRLASRATMSPPVERCVTGQSMAFPDDVPVIDISTPKSHGHTGAWEKVLGQSEGFFAQPRPTDVSDPAEDGGDVEGPPLRSSGQEL